MCRSKSADAFTLVELLVVITVIVILLAILAPALDKAVYHAELTRCASHQHQIGVATLEYAMAHRQSMPPGNYNGIVHFADPGAAPSFLSVLMPQFGTSNKAFTCPIAQPTTESNGSLAPTAISSTSYLGNGVVYGKRFTRIPGAGSIILIQEWYASAHVAWLRPWQRAPGVYESWHYNYGTVPANEAYAIIHERGGNLLFADAHVEYRKADMLRARDFGLTGGAAGGQAGDGQDAPDNYSYTAAF